MKILWQVNVRVFAVSDLLSELSRCHLSFGYRSYEQVDESPGIYCFWVRGKCLYVGMSTNLKRRLEQHCNSESNPILKNHFEAYRNEISLSFAYKNVSESELFKIESHTISILHPIANRTHKI